MHSRFDSTNRAPSNCGVHRHLFWTNEEEHSKQPELISACSGRAAAYPASPRCTGALYNPISRELHFTAGIEIERYVLSLPGQHIGFGIRRTMRISPDCGAEANQTAVLAALYSRFRAHR